MYEEALAAVRRLGKDVAVTEDLPHFAVSEFRHPELVDNQAAVFLSDLRGAFGRQLIITSDARTPVENAHAGGSSTSLHLLGRAFDLRWPGNEEDAHRFLDAYYLARGWKAPDTVRSTELELVFSTTDRHIHVGLYPTFRASRLIVSAE